MKRKTLIIAMVLFLAASLVACKSSTKKEIVGQWAYTGSTYCTLTFYENGKMKIQKLLASADGTYSVDGKTIYVTFENGQSNSLYLDNHSLFARDGSEYRKVSERP